MLSLELPATSLTPLVREPGRVVVTDARLYFQPQHNITGDAAVYSHPLPAVAAVARRRSSLRDVGGWVERVGRVERVGGWADMTRSLGASLFVLGQQGCVPCWRGLGQALQALQALEACHKCQGQNGLSSIKDCG